MFLKGIKLILADGQACPTQQCRFIEYEDLPLYNSASPPACIFHERKRLTNSVDDISDDKLEIC